MGLISALLGALVGSIVSVLMTSYYARKEKIRQNQVQTALNLYWQLHSDNMLMSRSKAETFLEDNRKLKKPRTISQLYTELEQSDYHHISNVLALQELVC